MATPDRRAPSDLPKRKTPAKLGADTDLIPAIDVALQAGKRVETATWHSRALPTGPLKAPHRKLWNHWLDRQRFEYVRDDTDYLTNSRDRRATLVGWT